MNAVDSENPDDNSISNNGVHCLKTVGLGYTVLFLCIFVLLVVPQLLQGEHNSALTTVIIILTSVCWNIVLAVVIWLLMFASIVACKFIYFVIVPSKDEQLSARLYLRESFFFARNVMLVQMTRKQMISMCDEEALYD
ncbi:MAG: hypothetical protein BVN35_05925 [Proteobacteria bacterium ST_bin11]|nr:MAG: hypothetical protein BVN35_05925 [Proteobacteria bacterium ST_bin11]